MKQKQRTLLLLFLSFALTSLLVACDEDEGVMEDPEFDAEADVVDATAVIESEPVEIEPAAPALVQVESIFLLPVFDGDGDEVGILRDLIFNAQGDIELLILETVDGFTYAIERDLIIPQLEGERATWELIFTEDVDVLGDGFGVAYDPEVIDVDNFYTSAAVLEAASIPIEPLDEDDPYFWGSSYTDFDLRSSVGEENLGEVEQLSIDLSEWQVAYGVVDVGGFLGIDEKQVPIPWQAFGWDEKLESFTLPLEQATLEAAPEFNLAEEVVEEGEVAAPMEEAGIQSFWEAELGSDLED